MTATVARHDPIAKRLRIYQRERFPLITHFPLVVVVVLSALGYTVAVGGSRLSILEVAAVAITTLLFFVQLRIADEFKDASTDARFRPHRAVPRGLVTLRELGAVGIAGAAAQVFLTVSLTPKLLPLLLGVWVYMALMFREFFAADRLRSAPILYAVSHMVVMPLIVFYIMAAAWTDAVSPAEIAPLLATAFFVGLSAEIGRKIRAPQDEKPGVETYSALFGRIRAVRYWLASLAAATGSAVVAAISAGRTSITIIAGAGLLVAAVALARYFTHRPTGRAASAIEYLSGAAVVLLYSVIGLGPILGAGA